MKSLLLIIFLAFVLPISAQEDPENPYAARGSYPVGTREFVIEDVERPLNGTLWYPAVNPAGLPEEITYQQSLMSVSGHALRDAVPNVTYAPYPLILFSHGSGASRLLYTFLLEHLASYGFIVAAVDHPGNTVLDMVQVRQFTQAIVPSYVHRPQDIQRLYVSIQGMNEAGNFAGLIDMERVALAGHSFGGYTVLSAAGARWDFDALQTWCDSNAGGDLDPYPESPFFPTPPQLETVYGACFLLDEAQTLAQLRGLESVPAGLWDSMAIPGVDAVLVMAPWNAPIYGEAGLAEIQIPALVMGSTDDNYTFYERDALRIYENLGSPEKYLVTFEEANHFIYINQCPAFLKVLRQQWGCTDSVWEMQAAHEKIVHYAAAFMLNTLYNDEIAASVLPD